MLKALINLFKDPPPDAGLMDLEERRFFKTVIILAAMVVSFIIAGVLGWLH